MHLIPQHGYFHEPRIELRVVVEDVGFNKDGDHPAKAKVVLGLLHLLSNLGERGGREGRNALTGVLEDPQSRILQHSRDHIDDLKYEGLREQDTAFRGR
jgi:hypothetical protein